ncbi:MAG: hypothetical protein NTZ09_08850 [Candidatus Hydrogenedentes bacterium]|nr:hypothetical protein [Candidatus Hydrogenedentota bacterium]
MRLVLPLVLLLGVFAGRSDGFVVVCPIHGVVDDGMRVFVERVIRESGGAQAIIFEVDTPGGRIDSAIDISNAIVGTPVRTIAYIKGMGAISAGALISYSCDDLIMSAEADIGAATPVQATAEGVLPTGEKEVSYMRARMRSLAERKGRNPALAEAMVDKDIELHAYTDAQGQLQIYAVYTGGRLEPPKTPEASQPQRPGEIDPAEVIRRVFDLSLGDGRLRAQVDGGSAAGPAPVAGPRPQGEIILPAGKLLTLTAQEALHYGLIPAIVKDFQGVLSQYGFEDAEVRRLEMADWFDVILVVSGLALIAIEIFVLPGFGFVGAAGILCLLVGLYMTLTTAPIPEFSWEYDRMADAMKSLLIATLSLGLLIYATWRFLPQTAMYGRLVQTHEQLQERGYVVQSEVEESAALGQRGVALSMLRPAGRGRFGEKTLQVVSRAEYIEPGTPIVIVQVDGNRYVVDRLEEQT